jgi:hypothetical protein
MAESNALPAVLDGLNDARHAAVDTPLEPWGTQPVRRGPNRWFDAASGRMTTRDQTPDDAREPGDASQLRHELRSRLRRAFVLIDQYWLLCRLDSERHRLEALVQALISETRGCFDTAAMLRADISLAALVNVDHAQCVGELEALARTLRGGSALSALELMHALDSVVVHCAVMDCEQRDTP